MGINVKDELAMRYGKRCMFTLVREGLTYHHIQKDCDGGPKSVDNGALLTSISQSWLHNYIENKDPEMFDLINECLVLYKMCIDNNQVELIQQYREEVIPRLCECISKYDMRTSKGKHTKCLRRK